MTPKHQIMTKSEITAAYTLPHKRTHYREFEIDLTDLLRRRRGFDSPWECHISCAFETLRWIEGLAWRWCRRHKAQHPIKQLESEETGVVPSAHYRCVEFGSDWATARFGPPGMFDVVLLAAASSEVEAWRRRYRLRAHERHAIVAPTTAGMRRPYLWDGYSDSRAAGKILDELLAFTGDLQFSPNKYHPRARRVYPGGVRLNLATWPATQWQVHAHYSYANDPGSSWYVLVAQQQGTEAFHYFVERALQQLRNMCEPKENR